MKLKSLPIIALLLCLPFSNSIKDNSWHEGLIENVALDELSGLAASAKYKNLYWGINDSGNKPFLFALQSNGRHIGKVAINGAKTRDIEALAIGNCTFARKCIFIADIGDNDLERRQARILIAPEPSPRALSVQIKQIIYVQYPDGPHDAEAMMVHPKTQKIYVIEKLMREFTNRNARVFEVPEISSNQKDAHVTLKPVSSLARTDAKNNSTGPFTDASFLNHQSGFYIRDYRRIYRVNGEIGIKEPLELSPIKAPPMMQGEAIAVSINDNELVLSSEGRHAAIATINIETINE